MFFKQETEKKTIFTNDIKLNKSDKKNSNSTPNVTTKISAYDRIVSIVTHDDNTVKQDESVKKKVKISV